MPYYGSAGDPGLFGKIFKKLKHIKLGRFVGKVAAAALSGTPVTAAIRGVTGAALKAEKGRFLSRFGYRPSSPAPGAVTKVQAINEATGRVQAVSVAPRIAQRFKKARRKGARARLVGGRVKYESSFARRRRLGLI
jgi:hypothetical protein